MQSVADRIAELQRTKKRPAQSIANWIARERRRGNHWLADSIAQQAGVVTPKPEPAVAIAQARPRQENSAVPRKRYWWLDD